MPSDQDVKGGIDDGKIEVTLNDKPLVLEGSKQTGESIKKAAIERGVNIKQDFVLSIERGGGKTDLVGETSSARCIPRTGSSRRTWSGMTSSSRCIPRTGSSRSRTTITHEHDRSRGSQGNRGDPFHVRSRASGWPRMRCATGSSLWASCLSGTGSLSCVQRAPPSERIPATWCGGSSTPRCRCWRARWALPCCAATRQFHGLARRCTSAVRLQDAGVADQPVS